MTEIIGDTEKVAKWIALKTGWVSNGGVGLGLQKDGELIAGVLFDRFYGKSISLTIAATGKKWMTRNYLWACLDYPFNVCKVAKIITFIDSTNAASINLAQRIGFIKEAEIKNSSNNGDLLIYTLTRNNCRHLKEQKT